MLKIIYGNNSSVAGQEIGWEDCLQNDLFCIQWDVKPDVSQSVFLTLHSVN